VTPRPPLSAFVPLVGFLLLLTLAAVLDPTRGHLPTPVSLAMFVTAVAGCSLVATPSVAFLLAGCAWFDYDGFVAGRDGTLSWHGSTDVARVAMLAGAALAVLVLRRIVRNHGRRAAVR
jgi:hypothetical protein